MSVPAHVLKQTPSQASTCHSQTWLDGSVCERAPTPPHPLPHAHAHARTRACRAVTVRVSASAGTTAATPPRGRTALGGPR